MQKSDLVTTVIWIAASAIWPLLMCSVAEAVFLWRFNRGTDKDAFTCPPRDAHWERRVSRRILATGVILYATVAIAMQFA